MELFAGGPSACCDRFGLVTASSQGLVVATKISAIPVGDLQLTVDVLVSPQRLLFQIEDSNQHAAVPIQGLWCSKHLPRDQHVRYLPVSDVRSAAECLLEMVETGIEGKMIRPTFADDESVEITGPARAPINIC